MGIYKASAKSVCKKSKAIFPISVNTLAKYMQFYFYTFFDFLIHTYETIY